MNGGEKQRNLDKNITEARKKHQKPLRLQNDTRSDKYSVNGS